MPRTKKTLITRDAASELEELIGEYLAPDPHGFGNPKRDILDLLRACGCPKDVTSNLFLHMQSVIEDVKYLENELTRGNAETVAEGCAHLDKLLDRYFRVDMPRKNQTYKWAVWS